MTKHDFDKFIKEQTKAAQDKAADWEQVRGDWLSTLDEFYKTIEGWLEDYVSAGQIKIEYAPLTLNEMNIGQYITKQLILNVGRYELRLSPVGRLIIGAQGRVDLEGPAATIRFIRVDKSLKSRREQIKVTVGGPVAMGQGGAGLQQDPGKLAWKISGNPPSMTLLELTQSSFFDCVMEATGG